MVTPLSAYPRPRLSFAACSKHSSPLILAQLPAMTMRTSFWQRRVVGLVDPRWNTAVGMSAMPLARLAARLLRLGLLHLPSQLLDLLSQSNVLVQQLLITRLPSICCRFIVSRSHISCTMKTMLAVHDYAAQIPISGNQLPLFVVFSNRTKV
jgi:hypothetical protein